jgi:hypothetical protein
MSAQIKWASACPAIPWNGIRVFGPTLAAVLVKVFGWFFMAHVLNRGRINPKPARPTPPW